MQVIRTEDTIPQLQASVISVGNFDGIHRGHQVLLQGLLQRARERGVASVLLTFEPHTRAVISPDITQPILSTFEEKALLLSDSGLDYLVRLPFNEGYRQMGPEEFITEVLIKRYRAVEWVLGENHSFGRDRAGSTKFLRQIDGINHFNTFITSLQTDQAAVISSTAIRSSIIEGAIDEAVGMLGHPYLIRAERIAGIKKGTELGFPTLNFKTPQPEKVLPPSGVYAAELEHGGQRITGALYFGNCPTFGDRDYHFEFHSLQSAPHYPDYGETGALWVHRFVRRDQTFASAQELVKQMEKDINTIKHFFSQE
jgi:riboflavin kinase/FMN adenylyltransferase